MKVKPEPVTTAPMAPITDAVAQALAASTAETLKSLTALSLPMPSLAQLQTDYLQQATALWNQSLQQFQALAGAAIDKAAVLPVPTPVLGDRRFAAPDWAENPEIGRAHV